MTRFKIPFRKTVTFAVLLAFSARLAPAMALAESPVKLTKFVGAIDVLAEGVTPFVLEGTASHLGKFTAQGEVAFAPGEEDGSLVGEGVVVFTAANGDLLVGVVAWNVDAPEDAFAATDIHISWRDSVEFSDGTVAVNTGRFVEDRPPGLVVVAIIAILINSAAVFLQRHR